MRQITEINVHCSATRPGWMAGRPVADQVAEIRRWHVETNGWRDIGYHYVIGRDGTVIRGRAAGLPGAFEPKVNRVAIGVCLIGGYGSSENDTFEAHYTPEQDAALRGLIDKLRAAIPGIRKVTGHNDYAAKACPGFKVGRWLAGKGQRSFAESGTAVGSGAAVAAGGGLAAVEVVHAVVTETREQVQQTQTVDHGDPLRWVLLAVILAGASYALWRRWRDWQSGRQ